jgi:maltooligosyltrehalose trehalohydrolase
VSFEDLKLAAGIVLLSPYLPLLFMGEEYAESASFPYFISHSDAALIDAVRRGRQSEFASFDWHGEIPDPQSETTFLSAKLHHELRTSGAHAILWAFYKQLIGLRKQNPALARLAKESMDVVGHENEKVLLVRRRSAANHVVFAANLSADDATIALPFTAGCWRKLIDSAAPKWRGAGALPDRLDRSTEHRLTFTPRSFAVFECALPTRGPE